MKKSKIGILVLAGLFMATYAKAREIKVDFDGKAAGQKAKSFTMPGAFFGIEFNIPVPEREAVQKSNKRRFYKGADETMLNYSIMNSIEYCGRNNIKPLIKENLEKLLAYGTETEKRKFLNSPKYVFPERFKSMRKVDFSPNKGTWVNVCTKENCRMEEVCNQKEECEILTSVACGVVTGLVADFIPAGWIIVRLISYGTGGWVCYEISKEVCKNVEDCQKVEKCDEVCNMEYIDVQPGECATASNGQTVCQ